MPVITALDALAIPDDPLSLAAHAPAYLDQFPTEHKLAAEWAQRESGNTLMGHRQTLKRLMVRASAAGHELVMRGLVFRDPESEDFYRALCVIAWRCLALHHVVDGELDRREEERKS